MDFGKDRMKRLVDGTGGCLIVILVLVAVMICGSILYMRHTRTSFTRTVMISESHRDGMVQVIRRLDKENAELRESK